MQKTSKRHKLTSDNNLVKFKKPVHDPFKRFKLNHRPAWFALLSDACVKCDWDA